MRTIENIITGELVRIPRKLKKKIRRTPGIQVSGFDSLSKFVFITPWFDWVPVRTFTDGKGND